MRRVTGFFKNLFQDFFPKKRKRPLTQRAKIGLDGENLAADFLKSAGIKIVIRNWRSGNDEIDIVARDAENLVFVEVKTRTGAADGNDAGVGYFAVNRRKRDALARACRDYMNGLRERPAHYRFDIVEVILRGAAPPEIRHHKGVPLLARKRRRR